MYSNTTKIRVRYGETDQMGYVYYGNYGQFFEIGRVELLRSLGFSYKSLEAEGIMLPVTEYTVKYLRPAFYDDELSITTTITTLPGTRIIFDYEIRNEKDELLSKAKTTLVFVKKENMRPTAPPAPLIEKLSAFFND